MTSTQMKDLFETIVAGGPADRLDLDRAVATGRRRRRLRNATTAGSLLGVLAVAGVVAFAAIPHTAESAGSGVGAASISPTTTHSESASPVPSISSTPNVSPVLTVKSGQKVDLGSGSYLTVTAEEKCFVLAAPPAPPTSDCKSLTDGNQGPNTLSFQGGSAGLGKPELINGIYSGSNAALITVTFDGVTRAATIVKLGAQPKSLVYYLVWPTRFPDGAVMNRQVTFQAFDAAGRSIAKM